MKNDTIVLIADPKVLAIPIVESNEPLIDLKQQNEVLYGPPPECEETKNDYTKIRKTVFEKLLQAQKNLPDGWRFRLYEGFRSIGVQQFLFDQRYQIVANQNPHYTHEQCFLETIRLVSPVTNLDGSKNIPAHNTGASIDIEIINSAGMLVDMGMAAKDWLEVDPDLCETNCQKLNPEAKINRRVLKDVMESQGFVNYPAEWWHFSYGDRYWAYYKKAKQAIYGSADKLTKS